MKRFLIISVLSTVLALCGCVTGYQKSGITGGYNDQIIAKDTTIVTFKGNGFSNPKQTYAYAMKRAAELTLQNGYSWFTVLSNRSYLHKTTAYASGVPMHFYHPTTELKIQFQKNKTANAYTAKKVIQNVDGES